MLIRSAHETEREQIVDIYRRSQAVTGIPNPEYFPPDKLEELLYERDAVERLVAVVGGKVVCHTLIEQPNPGHIPIWEAGLRHESDLPFLELGGSFVDPDYGRRGIWGTLLWHSILIARLCPALPVSATWDQNEHVKRKFISFGGREVGTQPTPAGEVSLFVFE